MIDCTELQASTITCTEVLISTGPQEIRMLWYMYSKWQCGGKRGKIAGSVANAKSGAILDRLSHEATLRATMLEVHHVDYHKLVADPDLPHHSGVGLLPLGGKLWGHTLLVCSILIVEDTIGGTHKWCHEGLLLPAGISFSSKKRHGWRWSPRMNESSWVRWHLRCSCRKTTSYCFPYTPGEPICLQHWLTSLLPAP